MILCQYLYFNFKFTCGGTLAMNITVTDANLHVTVGPKRTTQGSN